MPEAEKPAENAGKKAEREIRWSMPVVSDDGKLAVASARSADNKDRWLVTLDAETGKTKVIDTLHDDAWVREAGIGGSAVEFLRDNKRVWFLSERDGWMHLYTLDVIGRRREAGAADVRELGDHARPSSRATAAGSTSRPARSIRASGISTRCRSTAASGRGSRR